MTVYYSPAWMAEMDRRAPARTAVRRAELPISVETRPTWALTVNIIRWRSCKNNATVYLSGALILEGSRADLTEQLCDLNAQTPSWWRRLWGVKRWALLSLAEEAMRSKTTVWGSSLSACMVIALGGEKKKERGLRGRRLWRRSRRFVRMCSDLVWRCAIHWLQACWLHHCPARRVNIDGCASCHWVAPPGWLARLGPAHCLGQHSWGSRNRDGRLVVFLPSTT